MKMNYYRLHEKIALSLLEVAGLEKIGEEEARKGSLNDQVIFFLGEGNPEKLRRSFSVTDLSLITIKEENLQLLEEAPPPGEDSYPLWFRKKIKSGRVKWVNLSFPTWREALKGDLPQTWKVHVAGLGDVGGMLVTGLRLLGGGVVSEIGIYDRGENKMKRWEYEGNQIFSDGEKVFPQITRLTLEEMFHCDLFVFCISAGVPPLGAESRDVRLAQLAGNGPIIETYARAAREQNFQGIFAVVSDPVDQLCKLALRASNVNREGHKDYRGLAPEQIRGYGLGVMHARAVYYAAQNPLTRDYPRTGRAFGPHGSGLVIANSIIDYDDVLSQDLTEKTVRANLEVRSSGYKPYVAPALSSGALSLLATMEGRWHYSATFMGGVFMGARNRLRTSGTELERLPLPSALMARLEDTYHHLSVFSGD